jgi:hypothetical protein
VLSRTHIKFNGIRKCSEQGFKVKDLFQLVLNAPDLWERAYLNYYPKPGNMTPGVDGLTIDGDSDQRAANICELLRENRWEPKPVRRVYIPKPNGTMRPLGIPMGPAYCISLQRRLGIAVVAPTSMNAIDQLTQYNELGVADQVSSGKNRSESVRITSNCSGLLTSTPTACLSVNDGLVGQTLMAVQSCHARRRDSWPFTS